MVFSAFIFFEIAYSVNTFLIFPSYGIKPWAYSKVANDTYPWGYNELGKYLDAELSGKIPETTFPMTYTFLNNIQASALEVGRERGYEAIRLVIVYDENVYNIPQLWYLERLSIYHAWPVFKASTFMALIKEGVVTEEMFDETLFILPNDQILQKPVEKRTKAGSALEEVLRKSGVVYFSIVNRLGEEAFRIYRTDILPILESA